MIGSPDMAAKPKTVKCASFMFALCWGQPLVEHTNFLPPVFLSFACVVWLPTSSTKITLLGCRRKYWLAECIFFFLNNITCFVESDFFVQLGCNTSFNHFLVDFMVHDFKVLVSTSVSPFRIKLDSLFFYYDRCDYISSNVTNISKNVTNIPFLTSLGCCLLHTFEKHHNAFASILLLWLHAMSKLIVFLTCTSAQPDMALSHQLETCYH
jgi:hypothetical protein